MARTDADRRADDMLRAEIAKDRAKLPAVQQEVFDRIFAEGLRPEDLHSAYDLIQRTLKRNVEGWH